jgi:hypothetical protein
MADTTESEAAADQGLWTIPRALSLLLLLGVPLFPGLALGPPAASWAIIVLMVAGVTDYLDGKIARRFDPYSRIGSVLDPALAPTIRVLRRHGYGPLPVHFLQFRQVVAGARIQREGAPA